MMMNHTLQKKYETASKTVNEDDKSSKKKKPKKTQQCDSSKMNNTEECSDYDSSYINLNLKQEDDENFKKLRTKRKQEESVLNNSVSQDPLGELDNIVKQEKKKKKKKSAGDMELYTCHGNVNSDLTQSLDDLVQNELESERNMKNDGIQLVRNKKIKSNDSLSEITSKRDKKKKNKVSVSDMQLDGSYENEINKYQNANNIVNLSLDDLNDPAKNKLESDKKKNKKKKVNNIELDISRIESKKSENSYRDSFSELDALVKNEIMSGNEISTIEEEKSEISLVMTENNNLTNDNDKSHSENYESSKKIMRFIQYQKNLQQLSVCDDKSVITSDDEIWLVKCPQEVVLDNFIDKTITLDNKCKLKIDGETFCGTIEDEIPKVTVMTSEKKEFIIKNINTNGIITFKKRLPKPHFIENNVTVPNSLDFIPLPETKCRHPLLGSNYLQSIVIPESVQLQLNTCNNEVSASCFRCKKRLRNANIQSRKTIQLKRGKKIKKEVDSSDVWGSEQAYAENLFNF
ncbi:hypothetical protein ACJJTC_018854 [Scirpophaga incertulas]